MTGEQVRRRIAAVPFLRFEMLFADGRAILVPHPEVLAIAGDGVSLIVHLPDGVIEIIDLALVVSLRFKTPEVLGELTSAPAVP